MAATMFKILDGLFRCTRCGKYAEEAGWCSHCGDADTPLDRTVDGVEIEVGLRVVDYDRKHGVVEEIGTTNLGTLDAPTYWHDVLRDDGTRSTMDGSRLYSEKNYHKGL